ncbi:Protein CBR-ZTF-9 [Caenorhabditis briggsae]|uniref:C2H2-type domain-containing protein n=2 Tax=Caenorhabditis briggsae TaxID=6238 RepID=A0AAE9D0U7_CAEBR|nr:Protein CBR-ZTF-9 [Caenorhabditis briggsae]ULT90910.1 hypothetical protein L3Y34_008897 [Caenorhabditis briggsae]UMM36679.1 hypothetical protein L5515_008735 [Caenorhabditis briggsae]CAP36613.1 Protein CBR-ZTF-9 [Caenorhabditis briggsae]
MDNRVFLCVQCPQSEAYTKDDLEAHIASNHLNIFPYECEKCKFAKFPTEYALVTHCRVDHGASEFFIKYRYTDEFAMKKKELAQKMQACIGMISSPLSDGRIQDTVSSTMEGRVKLESPEMNGMQIQSPMIYADNSQMQQYHNFLDETLSRHEEERAGLSNGDGGGPVKPKQQIRCTMCGDVVSKQRSSMVYHANTRHGKYELYECGICHRKWQTIAKSDVIKHIRSHHEQEDGSIDETMVIDYRKSLGQKLREVTEKCFPERKKKRIGYTDAD